MRKRLMAISFLSVFALTGCMFVGPSIRNHMIAVYSNDENYKVYSGFVDKVELFEESEYGQFVYVISYELHSDGSSERLRIFSNKYIDLQKNDFIAFKTVPEYFYDGSDFPIVELIKDNEELLSFEDGKTNLIEWTKTLK